MRILLFEDDQTLLAELADDLRSTFDVDVAAELDEAWRLIADHTYDAIVCDLYVIDEAEGTTENQGLNLIGRLRMGLDGAPRWGAEVSIVAVTGASGAGGFDPLHVASSIGADLVVRKPIDSDALTSALVELIDRPDADAD